MQRIMQRLADVSNPGLNFSNACIWKEIWPRRQRLEVVAQQRSRKTQTAPRGRVRQHEHMHDTVFVLTCPLRIDIFLL